MSYRLIALEPHASSYSATFFEGAILAANMAIKPTPIESWFVEKLGQDPLLIPIIEAQFHQQYAQLMASHYHVNELVSLQDNHALNEFAQGFLTVWQCIEAQWCDVSLGDGSKRMLQALLTTMMLVIDEQGTQTEMMASGVTHPPQRNDMLENLDLMISEVANSANDAQLGNKSIKVNPFKAVGRNDLCPCHSGKKYKQCCLK
jgi:uncharacterized protein